MPIPTDIGDGGTARVVHGGTRQSASPPKTAYNTAKLKDTYEFIANTRLA